MSASLKRKAEEEHTTGGGAAAGSDATTSTTTSTTSTKMHPFFAKKPKTSSTGPSAAAATATDTKPGSIQWKTPYPTLLVGTYGPQTHSVKIASFDLDGTLITTKGGHVFAKSAEDWTWFHPKVPTKLRQVHREEGYRLVIFSNQMDLLKHDQKQSMFKKKMQYIVNALDLPLLIIVGAGSDGYRKPGWKGFDYFLNTHNHQIPDLDNGNGTDHITENEKDNDNSGLLAAIQEHSYYVGDAAGRVKNPRTGKKDFSCSDRKFALNLGLKFFTPEEYFLNQKPLPFDLGFDPMRFLKLNATRPALMPRDSPIVCSASTETTKEIVLFVGPPASGKTSFYRRHFESEGYVHVNQDTLKRVEKCWSEVEQALQSGRSCVVDNTNPKSVTRKKYIEIAKKHNANIRCFHFTATHELCVHNNAHRHFHNHSNPKYRHVPDHAIGMFFGAHEAPHVNEGFEAIVEVSFKVSEEVKHTWTKHYK